MVPNVARLISSRSHSRSVWDLSTEVATALDALGSLIHPEAGSILFREGDSGDRIWIICEGLVKLSCTSAHGHTLNVKVAGPREVLGLSAIVSKSRMELTATVQEQSTVKVIPSRLFTMFLQEHSEAALALARSLSDDYQFTLLNARRLALSESIAARLANLLLDWGRATSDRTDEMRFQMVMTHDDLANFIGTTRESTTRAFRQLQQMQLIAVKGASVHIAEPAKLAAFAGISLLIFFDTLCPAALSATFA